MRVNQIYIVGAGAIGKALAVFLQEAGRKVTLVRGRVDNMAVEETPITVTNQDGLVLKQTIATKTFSQFKRLDGLVLITAKAYANQVLAEKLKKKAGYFSIVLLQNGLNIESAFEDFDHVYRCVLFSGGQMINDNDVSFKRVASSPVGDLKGVNPKLRKIVDQITTPYFDFHPTQTIADYIWEKVIINCAFNSICPLLEADNGIFQRDKDAAHLAKIVIAECVAVAQRSGLVLNQRKIEEDLLLISKYSSGQLVSTYQDIRNNRRTEIESLNLEIVRIASEIGEPELVPTTKLLGDLIRIKSVASMNTVVGK